MPSSIVLRRATLDDVESLTSLHWQSFAPEDHVAMCLGRSFIRSVYRWQVSGPGEFVVLAEKDARLVGFVAFSRGHYMRNMLLACWPSVVRAVLCNSPFRVARAARRILMRRRTQRGSGSAGHGNTDAEFELSFIAVDREFRGFGIAPLLLEAGEMEVAHRGGSKILVGVYKMNTSSRRAFDKAGWIERPDLETGDTVSFARDLSSILVYDKEQDYYNEEFHE